MICEMIEHQSEYPKYYVRIYERRCLDSKIRSKNVYLYIKGVYVTANAEDAH